MGNLVLIGAVKSLSEIAKNLPPAKAKELGTLGAAAGALLILSFALVGLAWWTMRGLRRRLRRRMGATQPIHDAWYQKPAPDDLFSDPDEPRP